MAKGGGGRHLTKRTEQDYLVVSVDGPPAGLLAEPFDGVVVDLAAVFDSGDEPVAQQTG